MAPPLGPIALAVTAAAVGSLFAAADAALTSLPEARLQTLVEDKDPAFTRYAESRLRLLSRWLVVRVTAISLAAVVLADTFNPFARPAISALVAVVVSVLTYATFAEIFGTIARRRPEEVGRLALRLLKPFELVVLPVAEPLAMLARFVGTKVPDAPTNADARLTETEVEWIVAQGEKAGALEKEPATMIRNVLDFKNLMAREVMVPRRHMSTIHIDLSLDQVLEHVIKDGHSRYPVYRDTPDNVIGLLYVKDLFDVVRAGMLTAKKLDDLIRKPVLFVTEGQGALSVLREMRSRRLHLAIVTDEFGGTGGLVTLEDIIEEIVGDIRDEYDTDEANITKLADGRFVADAAMPIEELEKAIGTKLPEEGDFESIGGLVVHRVGRVPEVGATVQLDGYKLIVREANETHVMKVEIVRAEPELAPPAETSAP
ncbi:MAG: HlyC/CorC family transporter [Labilithrix sp.]|nr:HlyC/CorC family transporter [Labilithrix sp.]MCW5814234.1 HlyC/CorC family transporter [Labilithrix sp.]